jgi:DNA-3-methyladenine glycosylase
VNRTKVLPRFFYERENPVEVAMELLGKILRVDSPKGSCAARIVEAEAYGGPRDRASHAWRGKTPRNESMFGQPGTAYVYLCYGIHRMFNVVTAPEGVPAAVLIRGVEPLEGLRQMARRRGLAAEDVRLTAGPGALTEALGIRREWDRTDLVCGPIRLEDDGMKFSPSQTEQRPRVGVNYAGPAARFLWRFSIRGNPWVSRSRG